MKTYIITRTPHVSPCATLYFAKVTCSHNDIVNITNSLTGIWCSYAFREEREDEKDKVYTINEKL